MKTSSIVALLAMLVIFMACDDDGRGTGTPTAPTAVPFTVSEPMESASALSADNLQGGSYYVLDMGSGLIQVIKPDLSADRVAAQGGAGISVSWVDEDTLLVRNIDGAGYHVDLDGRIESVGPVPSPTPPSLTGGGQSLDGNWQASVTAVDGPGVVVGTLTTEGSGEPAYRITSATLPVWSPSSPELLAVLVDVCSGPNVNEGFDLALFEPDSGDLRRISEAPGQVIPTFLWRPDGSAIVADVVYTSGSPAELQRKLVLIDVPEAFLAAGAMFKERTLLSISSDGDLFPIEWNMDGSKLLVVRAGPRGLCDSTSAPGSGTKVEPLPR